MKDDNNQEQIKKMEKITSPSRAVFRIILGTFAFLLWVILGVPPTLIYSSGIQTFIGTVSFIIRNPVIFLLIGLINIVVGIVSYYFIELLWYTLLHFLWSIRWFWGYRKYSRLKKEELNQ